MSDPLPESLLIKLAEWSSEASQRGRGRIDAELVHKTRPENVAIARLERYQPDQPDRCVAEVLVDNAHPYFFEHPIDHVPALLLIEAMRQAGVAAVHSFFGVPLDAALIIDEFKIAFQQYAELDVPLFIELAADEKGYRGERLTSARLTAQFIQLDKSIGQAILSARLIWWAR